MIIKDAEAIYPLSPLQEAVLLDDVGLSQSGRCNQWRCKLSGSLNASAFEMAWRHVVSNQQLLRAFFVWKNLDKPVHVVHKRPVISLAQQDCRGESPATQAELLRNILQADRDRRIDISDAPLMRVTLCRTAADEHQFIFSYHPLVLDAWSAQLVLKEVFASYPGLCQGQYAGPKQHRPYRDYIAWLKQQNTAEAEAFWRDTLRGFTSPTPLAVERPGDWMTQEPEPGRQQMAMSTAATTRLQSLAQEHRLNLSTLTQGALALLLSRYSDEQDVVFGLGVAGRPVDLEGVESIAGPFIQTLPLRVRVLPQTLVLDWLREIEKRHTEICRYQYNSQAQIRKWSHVPEGIPMFESEVALGHNPNGDLMSGPYAGIHVHDMQSSEQSNLPLSLQARLNSELSLQLTYDRHRFDDVTITRMLDHLQTILEGIVTQPEQRLHEVPLLNETEQWQLLKEPNQTKIGYPQDQCVHWLFEAQTERTPDIDAVVFTNDRLSYADLNQRANQLAHHLQSLGVGPDVRVAICVERSLEMLIGIIGILKAGGAYVPLDPSYPFERLAFMLGDAQVSVLLTQERLAKGLPPHSGKVVCLDSDWPQIAQLGKMNPVSNVCGDNLAYVIYTSGSTGTPKGVMVTHRGICNTSEVMVRVYDFPPGTRMLQFASLSFDMAVYDIIPAIISGATLCLAPQNPVMGADLVQLLRDQAIQVLTVPPSVLATLPVEELPELQFVRVAGEAISVDLAALWSPGRRFYNAYGPAEGSVWVTGAFLNGTGKAVIGRPISNTQIYLLNSGQLPVPVGVPGELCIGGISVSRGYLNQPGTTAERFIPDPFSDEPGMRLYRTGDLARYSPNGDLEFLGRTDHQVKLHGFRIELGEIESLLRKHPAVREAATLLREDVAGNKRMVGYVLLRDGERPSAVDLRNFLAESLPPTMVPTAFVFLDKLPLTPNGKLDRRALPAPDTQARELEAVYTAPRNQVEETLAGIWSEVLGRDQVGIHDNFFDLGGHSLLATQVASRILSTFDIEIALPRLFEATTVAQISELIFKENKAGSAKSQIPLRPIPREAHRMKSSALNKLGDIVSK
jgi:amino acid adenylation domain-containing protein